MATGEDAICRKKSIVPLEELGLPKGCTGTTATQGSCAGAGKEKVEHTYKKIKQMVSYAAEVTAITEKGKLRKITGVTTKELMLSLTVVEVYDSEASPEKVTFKTGTGLSETIDAAAFALGE